MSFNSVKNCLASDARVNCPNCRRYSYKIRSTINNNLSISSNWVTKPKQSTYHQLKTPLIKITKDNAKLGWARYLNKEVLDVRGGEQFHIKSNVLDLIRWQVANILHTEQQHQTARILPGCYHTPLKEIIKKTSNIK